ncbi:MAG TPA: acetate/propionate family kinase [Candidatus Deferrimicrobium sp.]|nr:acetate/propionate family kinase [Candidatus Deferrimicrobium sp.]
MRVLAVNAGSSSLKLSVVDEHDRVEAAEQLEADGDHVGALRAFITKVGPVGAVAHRLVHGGPYVRRATSVTDDVRRQLDVAAALAPLHVPPALALLDAARRLTSAAEVVCVDTAFHASLPESATTYAIPQQWRELGIRRYGFHGLSYAWASRRSAELLDRAPAELQLVIAHIGSGVSVCATRAGRSVDTSMGFTPLEGAVMASRSGTVDPGALLWLQQAQGVSPEELSDAIEHRSGLLALCGASDMREVERRTHMGDPPFVAALDVYIHALCRNIGAVAASLDRVDALVFTGGVGEGSALVRSRVCARLQLLGVPDGLAAPGGDAVIAPASSGPAVIVVTAREDAEMAREARRLLAP